MDANTTPAAGQDERRAADPFYTDHAGHRIESTLSMLHCATCDVFQAKYNQAEIIPGNHH